MKRMDGPGLAAVSVGIVFVYAGVKGFSPMKAFQNIIQGKNPNEGQQANLLVSPSNPSQSGVSIVTGAQGGNAALNQQIGKQEAAAYGWDKDPYWAALVSLWNSESNWSNTVWNVNASCGGDAFAYGIVQACGHGEHKSIPGHGSVCPYPAGNAGNPPECGGTSNAGAQIKWGLDYIKQHYGDPTKVPHGGY